jgi:hypothetical protein
MGLGMGGGAQSLARSELLLKANDHAMDATRYALHSELRLRDKPTAEEYLRELAAWMAPRSGHSRRSP